MKVLFWTDGFWPRKGGIETQGLEFIKGMQARGHEYKVFAQQDSPHHKEFEIYEGISIRRFDFRLLQQNLTCLQNIQKEVRELLDEFKPDSIHLYATSGFSILAFLFLKQMFHVPITLTLHAPFFYTGKNPILERIVAISDRVCCVSKWVLEQAKALLPKAAHKFELVYNGLPLSPITPTPLCFSPPVLLLLGRLAREKGFDTAILAFSLLRKSGSKAKLIIAGEGPERLSLETLIDQLELQNSVQFVGEFPKEEAFYWINQATLMIVPSYFEPFGLVALEAMQMKRAVIASRVGGLEEIILDNETGLLVLPQDPQALYKAIQSLLDQPELAISMGLNGYRRAYEFSLEKNLIGYESSTV